jgi:hypothetical protein
VVFEIRDIQLVTISTAPTNVAGRLKRFMKVYYVICVCGERLSRKSNNVVVFPFVFYITVEQLQTTVALPVAV